MGRHKLASRRRRWSPLTLAILGVPAAALLAASGGAVPVAQVSPAVDGQSDLCCVEVVAAGFDTGSTAANAQIGAPSVAAARYRTFKPPIFEALPLSKAPERGLQVKTILAARAVTAAFPEISTIGGVRPDSLPWHPHGLAIDVMIPNPSSSAGIALGDAIVAFALKNSERFALQDCIWRGVYYTPSGPQSSGYGHYDHVHITTKGGGYPTGSEIYLR